MKFESILVEDVCQISREAGDAILEIYGSKFTVEDKSDGSPLTLADKKAHQIIEKSLQQLTPDIPVLSEESYTKIGDTRLTWPRYWLVDPLDGTKEFIKRNGEFSVNIALIDKGSPAIGVVYAPVFDELYFAAFKKGAFKQNADHLVVPIKTRLLSMNQVNIVASRSHMSDEVKQFTAQFQAIAHDVKLINMGSSLKICLVAEGKADYYPRLGLTSEWDTAAAQCVLEQAGGSMLDCQSNTLKYSKENILNPWFIAIGDSAKLCNCQGNFIL